MSGVVFIVVAHVRSLPRIELEVHRTTKKGSAEIFEMYILLSLIGPFPNRAMASFWVDMMPNRSR